MLGLFLLCWLSSLWAFSLSQPSGATNATCAAGYEWTFNAEAQSPCLVASYLLLACSTTDYYVPALPPQNHYIGPTAQQANGCKCSTVTYSMFAACSACQSRIYLPWDAWSGQCSAESIQKYPEPIPDGTSIPSYAFLDVVTQNGFNLVDAQQEATTNHTEATASETSTRTTQLNTQVVPLPTTTKTTVTTPVSTPAKKSTNAGAIAGGTIGGVVFIALIAGLLFWLWRQRKDRTPPSAAFNREYGSSIVTPYGPRENARSPGVFTPKPYEPGNVATYPSATYWPTGSHSTSPTNNAHHHTYSAGSQSQTHHHTYSNGSQTQMSQNTHADTLTTYKYTPSRRGAYTGAPEM